MSFKQVVAVYSENFRLGIRMCLKDKVDFVAIFVMYGTLLAIFYSVYRIMPINELNHPTITRHNMIWYFAITEAVLIGMQGNQRKFAHMIADGQISTLMQRPGNMMGMLIARLFGNSWAYNLMLLAFALVMIPIFGGADFVLSFWLLPVLIISMMFSIAIYLLIGHMVCMLELFGSYSSPVSLVVSKLIFTFGGLFFPVIFFPPTLQTVSALTPFPAIISVPGNMMLNPTGTSIVHGLLQQIFWLIIMAILAVWAERRMIRYVLTHGD